MNLVANVNQNDKEKILATNGMYPVYTPFAPFILAFVAWDDLSWILLIFLIIDLLSDWEIKRNIIRFKTFYIFCLGMSVFYHVLTLTDYGFARGLFILYLFCLWVCWAIYFDRAYWRILRQVGHKIVTSR